MKVHIYSKYDTLDKIINTYAVSLKDLQKSNENIDLFNLKEGDRLIINHSKKSFLEHNEEIPLSSDEYQKYICPHCKNIILIPK